MFQLSKEEWEDLRFQIETLETEAETEAYLRAKPIRDELLKAE